MTNTGPGRYVRTAILGVATLLPAVSARAGLPDWAKAVAGSAPAAPEGSPEWPARTLLEELRITVASDGATWRRHERRAELYLSNRVADTRFGLFPFSSSNTKMKMSKGWHVPPGERAQRNYGGTLDLALSPDFETDARYRTIVLEGVRKGSLVFYEFDAEQKAYTLSQSFVFGSAEIPVDVQRVIVELPAGWLLRHAWLNTAGADPVHQGNAWTFELKGQMPLTEETLGPEFGDLAPRLVVAMTPPEGASVGIPTLRDWDDFARWFSTIAKGRDTPDASVQRAAQEALASASTEPLGRIRASALLVRNRVRYLLRAVGIGGYTPRASSETLTELNGDCKDKGTLLRAILAVGGFKSFPILIHATAAGTVADLVPDPGSFDHFVVGVLWPKEDPVPPEVASAVVEVPGIGTVLVVDTTDEHAWPGTIPANLAGHRGLLIAEGRGVLVTIPSGDPSSHRIAKVATVAVHPDRSARVQLEVTYEGWPAERARYAFATSAIERRKDAEQEVREAWRGGEVRDYKVATEDGNGAYRESFMVELPPGAASLDDGAVSLFAGAMHEIPRVPVSKRTMPVVFPHPLGLRYEAKVEGVSAMAYLPPPEVKSGTGWSVSSRFERDASGVHATWAFDLSRTRFEPEAFPELKQMWAAASRAAGPRVAIGP